MKFVNLNDAGDSVSFEAALAKAIGRDGGLYVPKSVPRLLEREIKELIGADRYKVASIMLRPWLADEIPEADLAAIIRRAATFDTPLVEVGDKKVLEMFHGPTMAFKDVAACYLAAFMDYFNQKAGRQSTVLVATSGDTGGAIAHGFAGLSSVKVIVLYPKDRVSRLQREQLRRVATNVSSLEVDGDFNDCQELVKKAFSDEKLSRQFNLTSANSINIGRLLPQITYYANIYAQYGGQKVPRVVVPTGNLGNLSAGLLARAMGVPIEKFLAATNLNDSLVRYLDDGRYEPKPTVRTLSNAMDVNAPNNLPRFRRFLGDDIDSIRKVVKAVRIRDDETVQTIKAVYENTGYLLDPHSAVGWRASELVEPNAGDVIVSTASPLKFAEEILAETGIAVDNHEVLNELSKQPERYDEIDNSMKQLTDYLITKLS